MFVVKFVQIDYVISGNEKNEALMLIQYSFQKTE